jgi:hypothetical protein
MQGNRTQNDTIRKTERGGKMKPIDFAEKNCVYAKDQPEYSPLPVHKSECGQIWSCWKLTFRERIKVLFTGVCWINVLTFNKPLQPMRVFIDSPFNPKTWRRLDKEKQ